jgi:hypothetical protein
MRHPFVTVQLRQARTAASIQTSHRPAPGVVPGHRVPRPVVWCAVILLVAVVAALGIPVPAGPAHAYVPDALAAQQRPTDAVERFRRGERASQEDSTPTEAVEEFRRGERASQEQPATDNPTPPAAQIPAPVQPDQPTGQPGWLVVSLGVLAAVLALVAGLALVAARRATRRARVGQAT